MLSEKIYQRNMSLISVLFLQLWVLVALNQVNAEIIYLDTKPECRENTFFIERDAIISDANFESLQITNDAKIEIEHSRIDNICITDRGAVTFTEGDVFTSGGTEDEGTNITMYDFSKAILSGWGEVNSITTKDKSFLLIRAGNFDQSERLLFQDSSKVLIAITGGIGFLAIDSAVVYILVDAHISFLGAAHESIIHVSGGKIDLIETEKFDWDWASEDNKSIINIYGNQLSIDRENKAISGHNGDAFSISYISGSVPSHIILHEGVFPPDPVNSESAQGETLKFKFKQGKKPNSDSLSFKAEVFNTQNLVIQWGEHQWFLPAKKMNWKSENGKASYDFETGKLNVSLKKINVANPNMNVPPDITFDGFFFP